MHYQDDLRNRLWNSLPEHERRSIESTAWKELYLDHLVADCAPKRPMQSGQECVGDSRDDEYNINNASILKQLEFAIKKTAMELVDPRQGSLAENMVMRFLLLGGILCLISFLPLVLLLMVLTLPFFIWSEVKK